MMHPVATGQDTVADPLEKLIIPGGGGEGVEVAEYFNRNSPRKKIIIWLWVWPLDPPSRQSDVPWHG